MPNVRLDQNGLPKGPVYESAAPTVHRSDVTSEDATDPANTSGAVDCAGYKSCRFDITIGGTGFVYLDVQVLFWNSRQSKWFAGASRRFDATGQHALEVDALGCVIFLKAVAFSGTSFTLSADYVLS